MNNNFDHNTFFQLLVNRQYKEALSYYMLLQENRYEHFKAAFIRSTADESCFNNTFYKTLLIFEKVILCRPFNDKNKSAHDIQETVFHLLLNCFKIALSETCGKLIKQYSAEELNNTIAFWLRGFVGIQIKRFIPSPDAQYKAKGLLESYIQTIDFAKKTKKPKCEDILSLYEMDFVLYAGKNTPKSGKAIQMLCYDMFLGFYKQQIGDAGIFVKELINENVSHQITLEKYYHADKVKANNTIVYNAFSFFNEMEHTAAHDLKEDIEYCIVASAEMLIDYFRKDILYKEKVKHFFTDSEESESMLDNVFARFAKGVGELTENEKIIALIFFLLPHHFKNFYIKYGNLLLHHTTNPFKRFSKETLSDKERAIRDLLGVFGNYTPESAVHTIRLLRDGINVYYIAINYFLHEENKKEIVKQNIFNDGTFENMLNNTEAIYDLEARHIPTYIWQLMSKELIIKQNSKSPEEQQEFDIIMRVHLISDDESIPPMQSQNYDEQKEFVISNWKKELDSIFKIINIFDKKTDIEKTTVVLSKERRLNNEEIWQYFQNRSHATTPNHINKTLYEWEEQTGY